MSGDVLVYYMHFFPLKMLFFLKHEINLEY